MIRGYLEWTLPSFLFQSDPFRDDSKPGHQLNAGLLGRFFVDESYQLQLHVGFKRVCCAPKV